MPRVITVLCGGVGAARLLRVLQHARLDVPLTAVVNVGDDLVLHGLTICPDLDTILYTLAGLNNESTGWGLRDDSFRAMEALEILGGEAWFRLGDHDLATHLYRSQRLVEGATKTVVTAELVARLGVEVDLLPVTDDPVATVFATALGPLTFQEYFVRHHHAVPVLAIDVVGATQARATDAALAALEHARRIVIAPSNPLISIDPILRIPGIRDVLRSRRDDVVAVSPIVNGSALKGPADRLLAELHYDVSCVGVADFYGDLVGTWIIDDADARHADALRERGHTVRVTSTIMGTTGADTRLAAAVLS